MGTCERDRYDFADAKLVDQFCAYIAELEGLVAKHGWELETQFRSRWCAFKPAERQKVAFGIAFEGSQRLYLYIKWVEDEAKSFPIRMSRYNAIDHQAEYILEPGAKLKKFETLLHFAYRHCIE